MSKNTMVELVAELEKVTPRTPAVEELIAEAKAGEYHDYKNRKYACGKVEAVRKLQKAGLYSLASQVRDGEYDERADEEDKLNMSRAIDEDASSLPQKQALKEMLGLPQTTPKGAPRVQGRVGTATEPPEMAGKFFFEIFINDSGQPEPKPEQRVGQYGPFGTEKEAHAELRKACQLVAEKIELEMAGKTSGKYFDIKAGGVTRRWDRADEN